MNLFYIFDENLKYLKLRFLAKSIAFIYALNLSSVFFNINATSSANPETTVVFVAGMFGANYYSSEPYIDSLGVKHEKDSLVIGAAKRFRDFKIPLEDFECDENGKPKNKEIQIKINEDISCFGSKAAKAVKYIEKINNSSGVPLKCRIFNYDYRRSACEAGEDLAKFIINIVDGENDGRESAITISKVGIIGNNYEDVINNDKNGVNTVVANVSNNKKISNNVVLICFSYGGLVGACAMVKLFLLGKSEAIVRAFMVGVPINGSANSILALIDPKHVLELNKVSEKSISKLPDNFSHYNFPSVWSTLPNKDYGEFLRVSGADLNREIIFNNGKYLKFLKDQRFSKKNDGTLKPFVINPWPNYLINGKHVFSLYDTFIILGTGCETVEEICFSARKNNEKEYGLVLKNVIIGDGDGVVCCNRNIPQDVPAEKIKKFNSVHKNLLTNFSVLKFIFYSLKELEHLKN